jgi:hypothetical protein
VWLLTIIKFVECSHVIVVILLLLILLLHLRTTIAGITAVDVAIAIATAAA